MGKSSGSQIPEDQKRPLVSVIIPTYNRAEMVTRCIESVLDSDYPDVEVLVVDNASTDDTDKILLKRFENETRLRIFRLGHNLMASGGRNAGMGKARGEFLLLLDNDNIVHPDMISELVRAFSEKPEADFIGALSVNIHSGSIWVLQGGYVNFWTSRTYAVGEGLPYPPEHPDQFKSYYETMGAPNAFMIRRHVLDTIGGFDESYYAMYEEVDFAYRMQKAGMKAYLCTRAVTDHYGFTGKDQNSRLRAYGIETPERAYHFAKNRFTIEKRFGKWYQKLIFRSLFANVFTVFYERIARSEGREDIAGAYRKGAMDGSRGFWKKDHPFLFQPYEHSLDISIVK